MNSVIFLPLGWYKRFFPQPQNAFRDRLFDYLKDDQISSDGWKIGLKMFQASLTALESPQERAYCLARASQIAADRDMWEHAGELINSALECFSDTQQVEDGKLALSLMRWIGGAVDWKLPGRCFSGCMRWKQAGEELERAEIDARRSNHLRKAAQIKACIHELNRGKVEIAVSVEGGYRLLNLYQASRLTAETKDQIEVLNRTLLSDQRYRAYRVMEALEKTSRFHREYPEVMVECAWAAFQLDNLKETIRCLNAARPGYAADRENKTAVLWMLGAAQGMLDKVSGNCNHDDIWIECRQQINEHLEDLNHVHSDQNQEKRELYEQLLSLLDLSSKLRATASVI